MQKPRVFRPCLPCNADSANVTLRALAARCPQAGSGAMALGALPLPRVCTFGIGPYCNHYALKQLATLGRGVFDVAFRLHNIGALMQRMMVSCSKPLLSDVTLSLPGVTSAELYPHPIPDLFCGLPLLVCGKYEGAWPEAGVVLGGRLPSGQAWSSRPIQVR